MIRSLSTVGICIAIILMAIASPAKAAPRPNGPTITPAPRLVPSDASIQLADEATRRLRRLHIQILERPEFRPYDDGTVCRLEAAVTIQA